MRRWPRERLMLTVPPLFACAFGVVEAFAYPVQPIRPAAVLAVLSPLPLLGRYRWPAQAAVLSAGCVVLEAVLGVDLSQPIAPIIVLGIGAFGAGARLPLVRAVLTGLILLALILASQLVGLGGKGADPVFGGVLTFGVLTMGRVLQTRQDALQAAAAASREVAVTQERTRIARELHDLIAHTVSVMVVQANAAEQVLRSDPDRAQAAITAVQTAGREALSETARLLDLLREGPEDATPQPGLADLGGIVSSTPGLEVDLHVDEPLPPLPAGAEVSVCRIVQEALMNVMKHSTSRRAQVRVAGEPRGIVVRIDDPGPPRRIDPMPGGHGLLGMRERIEMYGGVLTAGPRQQGWSVEACIPAEQPA